MIKKDIIHEDIACVPSVDDGKPIEMNAAAEQAEKELEKIAPVDEGKALKTKKTSKSFAFTLIFVLVNVVAVLFTAFLEFKGEDKPQGFGSAFNIYIKNYWWLIGAFLMFIVYNAAQALKRRLFLKTTLKKDLPLISMNAVLLCKYYDNITPLGSGGQPFEIYYLRKKGIPVGVASGVPLVCYALDRIAYVIVALTVMIAYGFGDITTVLKVLCVIGLVVNAAIPVALGFFTLLPATAEKIAGFVAKIFKFLHLTKDAETFKHKTTDSIVEYAECIRYFVKKSKARMLLGLILSLLSFVALYSMPYFVIKMSGTANVGWWNIFCLTVICYTTVTMLPTPGNSGGAEVSFRSIFASYIAGGTLFWAIMSWRFFCYYLSILVGLVLIISQSAYKFTKKGKAERARANKLFAEGVIRPKAEDRVKAAEQAEAAQLAGQAEQIAEQTAQLAEQVEQIAEQVAEKEQAQPAPSVSDDIGYMPVIGNARAITIHDADDTITTETIINEEKDELSPEHVVTVGAEPVIQVKAVISPKEGLKVTEVSDGTDEQPETEKAVDEKANETEEPDVAENANVSESESVAEPVAEQMSNETNVIGEAANAISSDSTETETAETTGDALAENETRSALKSETAATSSETTATEEQN